MIKKRDFQNEVPLRICLINPPQTFHESNAFDFQSYFPVGIAMIGGVLDAEGYSVSIIDSLAYDMKHAIQGYVTYGLSFNAIIDQIKVLDPHIIGISNPFSMFFNDTMVLAELVKRFFPLKPIVIGGIAASISPENKQILADNPYLDVLVIGEGEETIVELVRSFSLKNNRFLGLDKIAGIIYRDKDNNIIETSKREWICNLDKLPFPAYHLLDMDRMFTNPYYARYRYNYAGLRCLPVHTSRGCPYNCSFCSVHTQVGYKFRAFSTDYVINHIRHLIDKYRVSHIHFEDDNMTLDPERTVKLLDEIGKLGITWDSPNGLRADSITPEIASLIKKSGARSVTIAVESGSQKVLNTIINKQLDLDKVILSASALNDFKVPTTVFFVIGFPGETEEDIRETLRFAKMLTIKYNTINMLFVATPLPGTKLSKICTANGYIPKDLTDDELFQGIRLSGACVIRTTDFDKTSLLNWAKEELNKEDIAFKGTGIPIFWKNSPECWERASIVFPLAEHFGDFDIF